MIWSAIARRIRVPLGFAFAVVCFWFARPDGWSLVAGAILVAPGVWLRGIAAGHVQKNRELTATGPYARTRNPLYLGSVIIAAGFALAARNAWIALAVAVIFIVIYLPVIKAEENYLSSRFPEFELYAQRVPRFLPRLRASNDPAHHSASFSRELYWKHQEYNALLGAIAMFTLLVIKLLWFKP